MANMFPVCAVKDESLLSAAGLLGCVKKTFHSRDVFMCAANRPTDFFCWQRSPFDWLARSSFLNRPMNAMKKARTALMRKISRRFLKKILIRFFFFLPGTRRATVEPMDTSTVLYQVWLFFLFIVKECRALFVRAHSHKMKVGFWEVGAVLIRDCFTHIWGLMLPGLILYKYGIQVRGHRSAVRHRLLA